MWASFDKKQTIKKLNIYKKRLNLKTSENHLKYLKYLKYLKELTKKVLLYSRTKGVKQKYLLCISG